jgi:alkanesulfonate monooxygenase SsuD/methylene tetrahydromethanopterin reductase-like flavin-dependent oxidoreductase (luciferase family)
LGAVRLGVLMLPTDPWPDTVRRAVELEAMGYDHLWTYDHLSWRRYRDRDWHAAIPWLTGLAAATSRVRLGTMVSSPNFRHPVTLAKEAMTLDHISSGRFVLGVGAGGLGFDATVLGGSELPPAERIERFGEFVEVLDLLLRQPMTSYRGRWYTVHEARMLPGCVQQPRLPIAVASASRRTLALVARYGDAWITYGDPARDATAAGSEAAVRKQAEWLSDACGVIGRDPRTIDRIFMIGNSEEHPLASVGEFTDFAARYAGLGFTDLVFHHPRADDPVWNEPPEMVEAIATDVLPQLR